MSAVSLYDHLRFSARDDSEIRLTIDYASRGNQAKESDPIPTDHSNLICKTAELVRKIAVEEGHGDNCCGLDVHLLKNIPSAAGLGGASSNSAATLLATNRIWKLGWPKKKLVEISAKLGSDIPFFLTGATAICRGRGEKIEPVSSPSRLSIVIAKPSDSLSTAEVFANVDVESFETSRQDSSALLQGVQTGSLQTIGGHLFNRLEEFADPLSDQINYLRDEFKRLNSIGHQMSGSGSSYFGVFSSDKLARLAAKSLSSRLPDVRIFCSHTLNP